MISNSQTPRTFHPHSAPQTGPAPLSQTNSASGTRIIVKRVLKHRVRDRETSRDPKAAGKAVQTMSQFLLTKASVSFDQTDSARQVARKATVPSDLRLKQAANGYAECLYKQLLYNKNDSSSAYTLGNARRLVEATRQFTESEGQYD